MYDDKKRILDKIYENGFYLDGTYLVAYEGVEASGKTFNMSLFENWHNASLMTDWDFLRGKVDKKEILSMNSLERSKYIESMRYNMIKELRFRAMSSVDVNMVVLDRYFISTLVLHDIDDVRWLENMPQAIPSHIHLVDAPSEVIWKRLQVRENKNALDRLSIEEIENQREEFHELVTYWNQLVERY